MRQVENNGGVFIVFNDPSALCPTDEYDFIFILCKYNKTYRNLQRTGFTLHKISRLIIYIECVKNAENLYDAIYIYHRL